MTIEINDTDDFLEKLKSVFNALSNLKESGIDLEDTLLDDALEAFIAQFKPAPKIPLPPSPWRTPAAHVARQKGSKIILPATLNKSAAGAAFDLTHEIASIHRHLYEIVPLFTDD